jgi:hypothetical protein
MDQCEVQNRLRASPSLPRTRPDRSTIKDDWIQSAIDQPLHKSIQKDGRWIRVPGWGGHYLLAILLVDGETLHNAFFDRGFKP